MLQSFLDYLRFELNRAPLTVQAYETDILQFEEWISKDQPSTIDYESVTSSDIRGWLAYLAKNGDSPRTLRRKIISLRSLYKWMIKSRVITHSPLHEIPLPKIPKKLPELIKSEEIEYAIQKLKKEFDNEKSYLNILKLLVIDLLYSLGIRRAELAGINDSNISFSNAEIKVTGKRGKQRVVPLPLKLLQEIQIFQEIRDREELKPEMGDPLLIIKQKRISPQQIYSIVHGAFSDASARKKSPHALRHSFASGMLNGGAEIDSVREFLGHSSLATTQIYTHISLSEIKKTYNTCHPRSSGPENPDSK